MNMRKVVEIPCDAATAALLAKAVDAYARAAYPPGGSECSQVARETLLDTVANCRSHKGGDLKLRKRQLPQLRAAVQWWLSQNVAENVKSARGLERLLTANKKST